MGTSLMQFRVDDELKVQASAVCEGLGIDLPTALRMFMKRTVITNGIPFSMTLPRPAEADSAEIEMTDDEKIDFVAQRILREHRAAFEELAK